MSVHDEAAETRRRRSNRERVLDLLQTRRSVTNVDIVAIGGMRGMARVWELQQLYDISVDRIGGGLFRVTYRGMRRPIQLPLI